MVDERSERRWSEFGCVVDEEVETTVAGRDIGEFASMRRIRNIAGHDRNRRAGLLQAFGCLSKGRLIARREDERPALPGEELRECVSESAAGTGDKCDALHGRHGAVQAVRD